MSDKSNIEWTDATWNPIRARNRETGGVGHFCVHLSPGCQHCYAERTQPRFRNPVRFSAQDRETVDLFLDEAALLQPLRWKSPRRVFVCSMTDLFADFVPDLWIDQVFAVMALCPQHTFQVLTKRSARMRDYCTDPETPARIYELVCDMALNEGAVSPDIILIAPGFPASAAPAGRHVHLGKWPLPNVWKGVSTEDQQRADERIPDLLSTFTTLRFISGEPLLGPVDWITPLARWQDNTPNSGKIHIRLGAPLIDWVIVGGESGPNARPLHPDWARSLRDQCQAAGVPFFFKQWGEWMPTEYAEGEGEGFGNRFLDGSGRWAEKANGPWRTAGPAAGFEAYYRVGKKRAGRLLDGREWSEFPA